jgi:HEAT repeat protein
MTALLFAAALFLQADPPPPSKESVKEALDRFAKAYRSKEPSDRAAAVAEVSKTPDEKVIAKLTALLVVDDRTVRIAAAKGLSGVTGELRKKTVTAMGRAFGPNVGEPLVVLAIVESMETMQDGLGYAVLKANLRSPDVATSKAAIEAAGSIRDKSFVGPMIEHARYLEAAAREATNVGPGGRTVTGGGMIPGGGSAGDPDAPKRARALVPLLQKSLELITQQTFKSFKDWADWWRREEPGFTVPK